MQLKRPLLIGPLKPHHAKAVYSLYLKVNSSIPCGYLTERSASDFEAIMSDTAASVSVGAWLGERLVAYSLCVLEMGEVYLGSPLIRHLQSTGEKLCTGKGTVVDPEFKGRQLMVRLVKKRLELMREKATLHIAGLVAVSNVSSLVNLFRAGGWVVGLEHDEYCLNFVFYSGKYFNEIALMDKMTVRYNDLEVLTEKFEEGWIGAELHKDGSKRSFTLHRLSAP